MVRIVTDSTADLDPAAQQELGITVVPLNVHFGDRVFRDGVDLSSGEFFRRLPTASPLPRTSQPSIGVFEEAFRSLRAEGNDVLAIHLSGPLSGTYSTAVMAAQAVDAEHIEVLDSRTASMALGFLVLEAGRAARAGASRAEIAERIRGLIPTTRILCGIDTLTYLEKGGRIGHARALLGSILHVKPMITLKDGEVVPIGRARNRAQMLDRMVELLERDGQLSQLAVLHGAARADADRLRERIAPRYPDLTIPVTEIGPVLGTHTGPGVMGFTYLIA